MSDMLKTLSDTELEAELKRRNDEKMAQQEAAQRAHEAFILDNIDCLLSLVPSHAWLTCSDTDPRNYWRGDCTRCALIEIANGHYVDEGVKLVIRLDFTKDEN